MTHSQQTLQQAFSHLNSGNLLAAAPLFDAVLRQEPQNFAALNGRGFIALQQNRLPQSAADFQQSLSINAQQPFAHKMHGIVLGAMGQFDAAMQAFAAALALDAKDPEVYFNRANFRFQAGQAPEALADLDAAIKLRGSYLEARANRANLLMQMQDYARAEKDLDYLVTKVTNNPDIWVALGLARHKVGKHKEAMLCNERALKLVSSHPDALLNSSSATYDQGDCPVALVWADRAIATTPNRAEAHYARAQALMAMHRFDDAIASYTKAIELNPNYAEAWMGRGLAEIRLSLHEAAVDSLIHSLSLNSDSAGWLNLGVAYAELGDFERAIEAYQRCLETNPDSAKAYNNLGLAFATLRKFKEAFEAYERSLVIDPDGIAAAHNLSLAYLAVGNYEAGWPAYENRNRKPSRPLRFDKPLWLGKESLSDKVILIHAEQGLGDVLQFCRYVNLVANLCRGVILLVPASLKALCETLTSDPVVITPDEVMPEFDVHIPLMSLPLAFGTTVETIPAKGPYLFADQGKVAYWRGQLQSVPGLKVGVVWSSGFQRNPDDMDGSNAGRNISLSRRNIDLDKFLALGTRGISLVSLQKGKNAEESLKKLIDAGGTHAEIFDYTSELHDFSDTAALIQALDLVISVDTSVAHLAGALGKPTWVLNRYDSCWRWFVDRSDSPWYPTVTVYNQTKMNDWDSVLERVGIDLRRRVAACC